LLARMIDQYSINTNHMYVTGLSMGGFGTTEYLQYYNVYHPGAYTFAAAAALSGANVHSDAAEALVGTPLWMIHGDSDGTVSVEYSRDSYRLIAGLGPSDPIPFGPSMMGGPTAIDDELRYTEIPGLGHSGWSTMYSNNQLYDWMFVQTSEPLTGVAGDVNQDGVLDANDIDSFIAGWLSDTSLLDKVGRTKLGDLNLSGRTDLQDVWVLHQALQGVGLSFDFARLSQIPEPASLVLVATTAVACLCPNRRRRVPAAGRSDGIA
jgi:hypothetical protein